MDRERNGIFQRARGVVADIFDSRETMVERMERGDSLLAELGGVGAVAHMPLHEIEEHLGLDQRPIYAYGNTYPSLAEMRRDRAKREERADQNLAQRLGELPPNQTLFKRIQGHFVEKAREEQSDGS